MRAMAAESGIDMKRPAVIPNTRKAHEATEFAKDAGRLDEMHRALFRAYWEEERNIGLPEVLAEIAESCGLDPAALREALDDGRYTERVLEQQEWSRAVGVTGVPTFIFEDTFALAGAQEYGVFRDIATRIARGALKGHDRA
jgi:predicted DsbA family dithiol-disulfide isomerase